MTFKDLSRATQKILLAIPPGGVDFDRLVDVTQVTAPELNSHLIKLECAGLVGYEQGTLVVSLTGEGTQAASELRAAAADPE